MPRPALSCFFAVLAFASVVVCGAETPQDEFVAQQVPAALKILRAYHDADPVPSTRSLQIVYWTPADREPAPQYRERLTRVMVDIQEFYKQEMTRLGFGERTVPLMMDADKLLKIHLVKGKDAYEKYNRQSGDAIRKECIPTLKAAGLDAERETIVIFCNMSNWNPELKTMTQNSPYYAGGGMRNGTAWQVDSPLLDPASIPLKEPMFQDGEYKLISLGKYNSIFVGGVCHELGHALGLPHNAERSAQKSTFGTALMGSGNRTYGQDRRGEGRGSFLTLCEALRLASHPFFSGSAKGIDLKRSAKISDVTIELDKDSKAFNFSGVVKADPPVYAVIGYMDPDGGSDYDAPSATAVPDADGKFTLRCDALKAGKKGILRITACQVHGGYWYDKALEVPYTVSKTGEVSVETPGKK